MATFFPRHIDEDAWWVHLYEPDVPDDFDMHSLPPDSPTPYDDFCDDFLYLGQAPQLPSGGVGCPACFVPLTWADEAMAVVVVVMAVIIVTVIHDVRPALWKGQFSCQEEVDNDDDIVEEEEKEPGQFAPFRIVPDSPNGT
eukprot:Skav218111  [mRNA]  locus=scaffold759:200923:203944:- [translate_table: standard]